MAAALKAEKDTSNKVIGYPWSPTLADAGRRVAFWSNCLRSLRSGGNPMATLTPSQIRQHGVTNRGDAIRYYKSYLEDAWMALHHLAQESSNNQFLVSSLLAVASSTGSKREVTLKAILKSRIPTKDVAAAKKICEGQVRLGLTRPYRSSHMR